MKNSISKSTNNTKKTNQLPTKVKSVKAKSVDEKQWASIYNAVDKPTSCDVVEIEKIVDSHGVSIRSKNSDANKKSRYGITPLFFYDTSVDFKRNFDKIVIVKPHNDTIYKAAINNANKVIKNLEKRVVLDFEHDVSRAKLVSFKNLEIARVESLRILTKANIIEKNHHEQIHEKKCHEEALKNIATLKEAKLVLNDKELSKLLIMLKHDYELELKNNEVQFQVAKTKIDELQTIYHVKRQLYRQQIKELNQGKNFNIFSKYFGRAVPKKIINEIKQNKAIPKSIHFKDGINDVDQLSALARTVDIKKLPVEQQKIFAKFVASLSFIDSEHKYSQETNMTKHQLNNFANEIKQIKKVCANPTNKIVLIDEDTAKRIVNAKKQSLIISKPANLYAINIKHGVTKKIISKDIIVRTKTIQADFPQKIDPSIMRQPIVKISRISSNLLINKEPLRTKTFFADDAAKKHVSRFKKVQYRNFDKNKYMKYATMEYTNYKWEWKTDALQKRRSAVDNYYSDVEYQPIDAGANNVVLNKKLSNYTSVQNVQRLKKLVTKLPHDPIVINNLGTFKKENLDVVKSIQELRTLTGTDVLDNSKTKKIIDDIESILVIYNELSKNDLKYRKSILKAQSIDRELANVITKQDMGICDIAEKSSVRYNKHKNSIDEAYLINLDNAKNQYLINKELIIDEEQLSNSKEEDIYAWNSSINFKKSNDFMNEEYKYENNIISGVIERVVSFNKNSTNPIPLTNIPSKILSLPVHSSARIDISSEKIGSNQYIVADNTDHKNKLLTKCDTPVELKNVKKIYILDKYRDVKDAKTKVALLSSYANMKYLKSVEVNKVREAQEIKVAKDKLNKTLVLIDKIYNDIDVMQDANNKLTIISNNTKHIQTEYTQLNNNQRKVFEKEMYNRTNDLNKASKVIETNNTNAELKLLKLEKNKNKVMSLDNKTDELNSKNSIKKLNPPVNNSKFHNLFRRKKDDEVTINEIIGKK